MQGYLRVSGTLNGCLIAVLRRARRRPRPRRPRRPLYRRSPTRWSGEEQRAAVAAVRRLPPRQREALVLRYFRRPHRAGDLVFGAERYWGFRGAKSSLTGALDQEAPLRFVVLHVTPGGGVRQSGLSLPFAVRPGQQPSIALSPDGARLAVAYGGGGQTAIVRVITLATGQGREWRWPRAQWTPLIQGQGSWTASGRTLAIQQWYVTRGAAEKPSTGDAPAGTALVRLVDTTGPAPQRPASCRRSAPRPACPRPGGRSSPPTAASWSRPRERTSSAWRRPEAVRRVRRVLRAKSYGALIRTLGPVDLDREPVQRGKPVSFARDRLVRPVREPVARDPAPQRRRPPWGPDRRPGRADRK